MIQVMLHKHDDVIKWKHFPRYLPFVRGIHRSPVKSPHKGQWRGALMFTLICVWINGCVNNREAGDLRRYYAHYGVTVMGKQPIHKNAKEKRKQSTKTADTIGVRPDAFPTSAQPSMPSGISLRTIFQTAKYKLETPQFTTWFAQNVLKYGEKVPHRTKQVTSTN